MTNVITGAVQEQMWACTGTYLGSRVEQRTLRLALREIESMVARVMPTDESRAIREEVDNLLASSTS